MKKITVILLGLAMVLCGVLTGCAKQSMGDYSVKLCASDSAYYHADIDSDSDFINEDAVQEKMFSYNGESVKLKYSDSVNIPGRHIDCYTDKEKSVDALEVGYYTGTGNIALTFFPEGDCIIEETLTTEAEYRAWVEDYLAELMPDEDLSQYEYSCTTSYVQNEGESSSYLTYEGFYTPQNENEEINDYSFDYTKVVGGYKTADIIGVTIDPDITDDDPCCVVSVGYSNHDFDNFKSVNLNTQKVKTAIEEKFRSVINNDSYEFKSCEIKNYTLVYENGSFGVLCGVSTMVEDISGITPEPDYPDDADPTPEHEEWDNTYSTYERVFVTIPTSDYTLGE